MANAFEIPGFRFSQVAAGAINRYRFVSVNASGAIQATASTVVVGVSSNETASGKIAELIGDGIAIVTAGKALTAGTNVYSDANGKVTDTGTLIVGTVLQSCTAADQLVAVKLTV